MVSGGGGGVFSERGKGASSVLNDRWLVSGVDCGCAGSAGSILAPEGASIRPSSLFFFLGVGCSCGVAGRKVQMRPTAFNLCWNFFASASVRLLFRTTVFPENSCSSCPGVAPNILAALLRTFISSVPGHCLPAKENVVCVSHWLICLLLFVFFIAQGGRLVNLSASDCGSL